MTSRYICQTDPLDKNMNMWTSWCIFFIPLNKRIQCSYFWCPYFLNLNCLDAVIANKANIFILGLPGMHGWKNTDKTRTHPHTHIKTGKWMQKCRKGICITKLYNWWGKRTKSALMMSHCWGYSASCHEHHSLYLCGGREVGRNSQEYVFNALSYFLKNLRQRNFIHASDVALGIAAMLCQVRAFALVSNTITLVSPNFSISTIIKQNVHNTAVCFMTDYCKVMQFPSA